MPRFVVTPWRDGAELRAVRDRLYRCGGFAGRDERQQAVNLIAAWKRRGPLPHAIDSSAALVDATLHDDPQRNSLLAIRNAYCAAFNRFVTGFCDSVQNSFKKMSMYDMAAELDMPGSFVELRHEATHEDLPSLRRLQMATEQALQWLWDHYWSKLDASLQAPAGEKADVSAPEGSSTAARSNIQRMLRAFVSGRRDEIKKQGVKSGAGRDSRLSEKASEQIVALGASRRQELIMGDFISLLLNDRMIVPSDFKVGGSMNGAYLIWDSLLSRLNLKLRYIEAFVERMFQYMVQPSKLDPKSDAFRAAMHDWILHVLTEPMWHSSFPPDTRQRLWTSIMTACMTQPGFWSKKLAKELLMEGDEDFQDEWLPIFEASIPDAPPDEDEKKPGETSHREDPESAHQSDEEMQDTLTATESPELQSANADPQPRSRGWRRWEGQWQSTPIGLTPT